jgi:hypothetical protein
MPFVVRQLNVLCQMPRRDIFQDADGIVAVYQSRDGSVYMDSSKNIQIGV